MDAEPEDDIETADLARVKKIGRLAGTLYKTLQGEGIPQGLAEKIVGDIDWDEVTAEV